MKSPSRPALMVLLATAFGCNAPEPRLMDHLAAEDKEHLLEIATRIAAARLLLSKLSGEKGEVWG